ncbi:hypothetical protein NBRC116188_11580 [Oceaniserpentilla sp. 4NH20-0058]|uniref:helix-turn-helix domain-containing protein n=1 Tax=Oceaniserpentilla sp. 4NH20-0058 TaxID=3127660 RepID=UPI00310292E5
MNDKQNDVSPSFGLLLKFWRKIRKISQESLALSADSSTRYISCLENAKSHPSRSMVDKLAEVLELGDRDSCYLHLAAGYLPNAGYESFHKPQFNWLRNAMLLTLKGMDPYPAALMDRYGNLLMVNKGWVSFYHQLVGKEKLLNTQNLYEFLFSQQQNSSTSEIKQNTLALILMSLKQEFLLSQDIAFQNMFETLINSLDIPDNWQERAAKLEPQASYKVQMDINHVQQNFYCVSQMVGALGPSSFVSEPRLIVNTLYPENPELILTIDPNVDLSHPLLNY